MSNVLVVEKYPTKYSYNSIFPFEFDRLSLVSEKKDKIYKKDIEIELDVVDAYKYVILVGAEPCKLIGKITSVTEYQGFLMNDKFLPMVNPMAVRMRPSLQFDFDNSINDIIHTIEGSSKRLATDFDVIGIQDTQQAIEHIRWLLDEVAAGRITAIAWDTETSGLYPRNGWVLGISLSFKPEQGVYIDSLYIDDEVAALLQQLANAVKAIFHNAKFDLAMLKYHFYLEFPEWECTMLMHYVLDETEGSHGLKQLALKHTSLGDYDRDLDFFKRDYCKKHNIYLRDFTYDLIPFEILYPYAGLDTAATIEIYFKFLEDIKSNKKLDIVYNRLLKEGTAFLMQVEDNGIPLSIEKIEQYIKDINEEIAELTSKLYEFDEVKEYEKGNGKPFNVNSPKQKSELFFDVLKLPVIKYTETGNTSTDIEVIEELAKLHPLPLVVNQIMKLKKVKSTYLEKFKKGIDMDGRIRTGFNLHTTSSGRLSSSGKFNAQQLPRKDKRPKKCIEARDGFKIVSQDLRTAEMYVAAVLSGDKVLQQIFIDGVDYHGSMAINKFGLSCSPDEVAKLFPESRQAAKTISFEILYKLNYREPALEKFKRLKRWLQEQEEYIKRNFYIYSHFGRKRRLEDVKSPNRQQAQHWVRSGINFLVQSVSSDINLLAGIDMQKWIVANGYQKEMLIFGLVHDSILAEVKDEFIYTYLEKLAEFTQKDRAGMSIPGHPIGLDVEIGQSYGTVEKKEYA